MCTQASRKYYNRLLASNFNINIHIFNFNKSAAEILYILFRCLLNFNSYLEPANFRTKSSLVTQSTYYNIPVYSILPLLFHSYVNWILILIRIRVYAAVMIIEGYLLQPVFVCLNSMLCMPDMKNTACFEYISVVYMYWQLLSCVEFLNS